MKKLHILLVALFMVNGAMAQWVPQNAGILNPLNSVFFIDPNNGFAVGLSRFKTTDGGNLWTSQSIPGGEKYDVFFTSQDTGYTCGAGSFYGYQMYKTTNAGTNWYELEDFPSFYTPFSLFFTDSYTGYAGCSNGYIFKTTDGGLNWSNVLPQGINSEYISSIFFINDSNGFAVTTDDMVGYILKTTNGGNDWSIKDTCYEPGGLKSIYFTDELNGYAVGGVQEGGSSYFGYLFRTANGGEDWIDTAFIYQPGFADVYFTDLNTGYIVGQNGLILKTTDAGGTWFEQYSGTTSTLRSVYFPSPDTGYIVGDSGIILKTTNGGGYPVGISDRQQTASTPNIYPNPASTVITFETPTKGSLSIHGNSGQQLLQLVITQPTTTVDVSGLKSGIYVIRVTGDKNVGVVKFIKQ